MLQNNMCFFPKVGGWRTHGPLLGEMSPKVACFFPPRWVGGDSPKRGTHWLETEAGKEGACIDQVLHWWPFDFMITKSYDDQMTLWFHDPQLGPTTLSVWTGRSWLNDPTITIKCVDPAFRSHRRAFFFQPNFIFRSYHWQNYGNNQIEKPFRILGIMKMTKNLNQPMLWLEFQARAKEEGCICRGGQPGGEAAR